MTKAIRFAALGAMLAAAPAVAQPVGDFLVQGANPDGTTYEGRALVERTGSSFAVGWDIQGAQFAGVGVYDGEGFAVAYSGGHTGVVLYREIQPGVWRGVWVGVGGQSLGEETWTRQ